VQTHYAQRYRTLWERHWWWRSRQAWLLGWIRRLHRRSPRRRILDVGCGDGLFFEALGRFGAVEGLEPDAGVLTDPRWRPRIRVAPLGPDLRVEEPYDLILLLDVLEHIADDVAALAAARRALRPGGHVLVTVPALPWLWSRHDEANQHHRRYGPRSLRRALRQAGFAVETVRFFFAWTVAPLLVRRLLAPPGAGAADYDVAIPPPALNRALTALSRCDHALGRIVPWPLGSSLLAIARRDFTAEGTETTPGIFSRSGISPCPACPPG
jgi:SAM-dependent methyltransferase